MIDPTPQIKAILADLLMQIALLQAEVAALRAELESRRAGENNQKPPGNIHRGAVSESVP